jgi:hypothetical protein
MYGKKTKENKLLWPLLIKVNKDAKSNNRNNNRNTGTLDFV